LREQRLQQIFGAHAPLFHELAHLFAQSVEIHALGGQNNGIGDLDRAQHVAGFEMQGVAQRTSHVQLKLNNRDPFSPRSALSAAQRVACYPVLG
jgi:hypothetical protein